MRLDGWDGECSRDFWRIRPTHERHPSRC
jgi:hypothetical protein